MPWWVWVLGAVAAVCGYAVWYMTKELKDKGVTTLATITRISGLGTDGDWFTLDLEWTKPDGHVDTCSKGVACDLGDLPRVGDKVEIRYLLDDSLVEVQNPTGILRRDQLPARGDA